MELPSFYRIFFSANTGRKQKRPLKMNFKPAILLLAAWILPLGAIANSLPPTYSTAKLKAEVAKYLTSQYQNEQKVEIKLADLNPKLRLPACAKPLAMTLFDPAGNGGNISVQVKCSAPKNWSTHVAAQVSIYRDIPIASRNLLRGEQVSPQDIALISVDISQLRNEYLTDINEIAGLEVKRNIGQGVAFMASALDSPKVIKRGELVTLESLAGSIKVISQGTALSDGRLGEEIRIKNNQSKRVINGTVIAGGIVRVH